MVIVGGKMVATNRLLGSVFGETVILKGEKVIYHGFLVIETCRKYLKTNDLCGAK